MTRGVGAIVFLQSLLPGWAIEALALLTHLGDGVVLFAAVALLWVRDRRPAAAALGILLGGFACYMVLKVTVALPRPPPGLRVVAESGYGFPSGHAVGSTVAFGLLAVLTDVGSRRTRFALAAAGVLLVSISRVAIGVHYLVDVVAGVAVGAIYLPIAIRVTDWNPDRALALAGGLGLGAIALGAGDAPFVVVAAVGTFVAYRLSAPEAA